MYRSQRVAWRIGRLRERLGATDPGPFDPLPPRPTAPHARERYDQVVQEIGRLQDELLSGFQRFNGALERLARRKKLLSKAEPSTSPKAGK